MGCETGATGPGLPTGVPRCIRLSVALLSVALATVQPVVAQKTALEIVDEVDRLLRGRSSRGSVRMEIVTEHWSRALGMQIWSLGTDYSLIRLVSPRKDAGTATLLVDGQMWNYLPRVDRTIRIPASLMGGAWMGSHFTNDDVVKESRIIEDYDITIGFEGVRDSEAVWEFVLTPKPEAAVVWGKIEEQVRKRDMMPVWARYYDEDGAVARTVTFEDFRVMGGRLVPTRMVVIPTDKPAERTTIIYEDLEFNVDLDESFFTLRQLRSAR
jgi:outer membrane lipoprotein-sorting protein